MKTIVIISLLFVGLGIQSCQSEYSERMEKAVALKQKYMDIQNLMFESKSSHHKLEPILMEIEKEIRFQAQISGNEELFLKEIWQE